MSAPDTDAIYDVLIEECGATENQRDDFRHHWPCDEYRFQGALGFGGKVRVRSWVAYGGKTEYGDDTYVSCYREDETPERRTMIDRANERLAALATGAGGS